MTRLAISLIASFRKRHGRNPDRLTFHKNDADALLAEFEGTAMYEPVDPSGWCPSDEQPAIRADGFFAYVCGVPAYVGDVLEGEPRAEANQ